jgi:hypothetical protein
VKVQFGAAQQAYPYRRPGFKPDGDSRSSYVRTVIS